MKKILIFISIFTFVLGYSQIYPEAKKIPSTFKKHQFSYQDDYSWMEKMNSPETNNWVDAENQMTYAHLEEVKRKYSTASKIKNMTFYQQTASR